METSYPLFLFSQELQLLIRERSVILMGRHYRHNGGNRYHGNGGYHHRNSGNAFLQQFGMNVATGVAIQAIMGTFNRIADALEGAGNARIQQMQQNNAMMQQQAMYAPPPPPVFQPQPTPQPSLRVDVYGNVYDDYGNIVGNINQQNRLVQTS